MLDWLVIGGGPHGVHTALRLMEEAGVSRDALRILDDEPRLLARWHRSTRNTGMQYLRSPSVHNLDLCASSLQHFANDHGRNVDQPFARPYLRPALDLFDLHCEDLIERHQLRALHIRGRATRLHLNPAGARVRFENRNGSGPTGDVDARRVVLAIGAPWEPAWPDWALRAVADAEATEGAKPSGRIRHIFEPGLELSEAEDGAEIAVIGAGISGAQVALRLAQEGRRVTLLSRHGLRIQQFDSDPGWQGPKFMDSFARVRDPNERRGRIRAARHRGSMPPDVHRALRRACGEGKIELVEQCEVRSARITGGTVALELDERSVEAHRVLLATGFPSHRPGGPWLDHAIDTFGLPCADCGYPIVDRGLRWHPHLLVTGALAELEIGPVSRNLSGARRAGDRITAVALEMGAPKRPSRPGSRGPGPGDPPAAGGRRGSKTGSRSSRKRTKAQR